jgi:NADH dehydrogenase
VETERDSKSPLRILILGGGFAGVYSALYLDRTLPRDSNVEVTLVNREDYFVFQPLLAEIVSGNIGILDTVSPLRRLLPRTRILVREVDAVDLDRKSVTLSPGFWPREHVLSYDHLVLALGTVTDFRGIPGLFEHALPFKNLADALSLRNHLIRAIEEATIEDDPQRRKELLTFVVAGGGFSGVEVAAEMNDFVRRLVKQTRMLKLSDIRVILVHSGARVLERELTESLSVYANEVLKRRGVELILNTRLRTASPDAAILQNGERIATKTVVSTVPSSPHPLIESLDLPKERGKIKVDASLRVAGHDNIWGIGDCALVPIGSTGQPCPPTAQHAVRQAKTLAHNVLAQINGQALEQFDFGGLGKLGSLGHHCAVAEVGGVRLSGFVAWFLWRSVYWWKLPGLDRKIKVGFAWFLDLLIPPEAVQLRVGTSQGVSQVHYEPGDVVFRQGDLGDSLYIILDGEAEVLIEEDGQERVVARMGPGEHFGEMALLSQEARTATVRCTKPMNALALQKADFNALASNIPEMRKSFARIMEERIARSGETAGASATSERDGGEG